MEPRQGAHATNRGRLRRTKLRQSRIQCSGRARRSLPPISSATQWLSRRVSGGQRPRRPARRRSTSAGVAPMKRRTLSGATPDERINALLPCYERMTEVARYG
ncbi:hypothetical protein MRX96_054462 [Rhipicephalus microplus]